MADIPRNQINANPSARSVQDGTGDGLESSKTADFLKTTESPQSVTVCGIHHRKVNITTNKIPSVILPEEIPFTRLILRRDRSSHFHDIGLTVERLHEREQGHDCVVVCDKNRFLTHRAVLCAHSQYFRKYLYESADQLPVDVPTDGVPSSAMNRILKFMYSGDIIINYRMVMDDINVASMLQMKNMTEKCEDFLAILLSTENLMTTLELAEKNGVQGLYNEAYKRLALNFYNQTKSTAFLLWNIGKVCRLLGNDHIIIETEMHVFIAAMRWMNYRRSARKLHFKRLMDYVRWIYMTTEEVLKCVDMEQELIKSNDVRPVLIDATWYVTLRAHEVTWKDYPIPLPRTRALRNEDPQLVVERIRISLAKSSKPPPDGVHVQRQARSFTSDPKPGKLAVRKTYSSLQNPDVYNADQAPIKDLLITHVRQSKSPQRHNSRQSRRRGKSRNALKLSTSPLSQSQARTMSRARRATHDGTSRKDAGLYESARNKLSQLRDSLPSERYGDSERGRRRS